METNGKTLSEILDALGWRHEPHNQPALQGRRVFRADGTDLGIMQAHECWDTLRDLRLID